jgi:tetratricopeptide (TPR) repeat protein
MPIKDLAAERRVYLPMIGLLLIAAEPLVRIRWNDRRLLPVLVGIAALAGVITWNRSHVWSSSLALWSDTVEKSPQKARAHFGLAAAEFSAGKYADAVRQYELVKGPEFEKDGMFYSNWALALHGAGHLPEATKMGRKAVELKPSAATYSHLAMYLAEDGDILPSLELLDKAEKDNPSYEPLYIERGDILAQTGHKDLACTAFQKAWALNPRDPSAIKGLAFSGCGPLR